MDKTTKDINDKKIALWSKKLTQLEVEREETVRLRGEAAEQGDLRENAAYQGYTEKAEFLSAQIAQIQSILRKLGVDLSKPLKKAA